MPLLAFFGTTIGKYVAIGLGILILCVIAYGGLLIHDNGVKNAALLQYNNNQLEQVLKEQKQFNAKMTAITESQKKLIEELNTRNKELKDQYTTLGSYLKSDKVKSLDGPADEIAKETIRRLREIE